MTTPDLANVVWRKSSHSSANSNCVEVAFGTVAQDRAVAARDSKNPSGPALIFTPAAWSAFLAALKAMRKSPVDLLLGR